MSACRICKKPIIDHTPTYAGVEHWDCHQKQKDGEWVKIQQMPRPELLKLIKKLLNY